MMIEPPIDVLIKRIGNPYKVAVIVSKRALYLEKNFSISEIAQIKNTSRQAIFKTITNSLRNIEELESLLGFLKKQNIFFNNYKSIEQCLNELLKIIEKEDNLLLKKDLLNNISKLQKTINKMKEEV